MNSRGHGHPDMAGREAKATCESAGRAGGASALGQAVASVPPGAQPDRSLRVAGASPGNALLSKSIGVASGAAAVPGPPPSPEERSPGPPPGSVIPQGDLSVPSPVAQMRILPRRRGPEREPGDAHQSCHPCRETGAARGARRGQGAPWEDRRAACCRSVGALVTLLLRLGAGEEEGPFGAHGAWQAPLPGAMLSWGPCPDRCQ